MAKTYLMDITTFQKAMSKLIIKSPTLIMALINNHKFIKQQNNDNTEGYANKQWD